MNFGGTESRGGAHVRRVHLVLAAVSLVSAALAIIGATGSQIALTETVFTLDEQIAPPLPARWVVIVAATLLLVGSALLVIGRGNIAAAARIALGLWSLVMVAASAAVLQSALNVTDRSTDIATMMGLSMMAPPMSIAWGVWLQVGAGTIAVVVGMLAWWATVVDTEERDDDPSRQWDRWQPSTRWVCAVAAVTSLAALCLPLYVGDRRSAPWMGSPGLDSWAQLVLGIAIVVTLLSMRRADGLRWVRVAAVVVALATYLASGPLTWEPVAGHRYAAGAWCAVVAMVAVVVLGVVAGGVGRLGKSQRTALRG